MGDFSFQYSLQQSSADGVTVKNDTGISEPHNLQQSTENGVAVKPDTVSSETKKSSLESVLTENEDCKRNSAEELASLISFETIETPAQPDLIRQPSPPAVLAEVQDLIPAMPAHVAETENNLDISSPADLIRSESPLQLHIVSLSTIYLKKLLCVYLQRRNFSDNKNCNLITFYTLYVLIFNYLIHFSIFGDAPLFQYDN